MRKKLFGETAPDEDEMLPEYDFSGGIRGKYTERYARATNLVMLDPDVSEVFPDSESVNRALRSLMSTMRTARTEEPAA